MRTHTTASISSTYRQHKSRFLLHPSPIVAMRVPVCVRVCGGGHAMYSKHATSSWAWAPAIVTLAPVTVVMVAEVYKCHDFWFICIVLCFLPMCLCMMLNTYMPSHILTSWQTQTHLKIHMTSHTHTHTHTPHNTHTHTQTHTRTHVHKSTHTRTHIHVYTHIGNTHVHKSTHTHTHIHVYTHIGRVEVYI